jgi:hypothetical protein
MRVMDHLDTGWGNSLSLSLTNHATASQPTFLAASMVPSSRSSSPSVPLRRASADMEAYV